MKDYYAPIEGIELNDVVSTLGFYEGNVIKYIWRAPYKGGASDCIKALWYIAVVKKSYQGMAGKVIGEESSKSLKKIAKLDEFDSSGSVELLRIRALKETAKIILSGWKNQSLQDIDNLKAAVCDLMVEIYHTNVER